MQLRKLNKTHTTFRYILVLISCVICHYHQHSNHHRHWHHGGCGSWLRILRWIKRRRNWDSIVGENQDNQPFFPLKTGESQNKIISLLSHCSLECLGKNMELLNTLCLETFQNHPETDCPDTDFEILIVYWWKLWKAFVQPCHCDTLSSVVNKLLYSYWPPMSQCRN